VQALHQVQLDQLLQRKQQLTDQRSQAKERDGDRRP
jgi:hypothetical protein